VGYTTSLVERTGNDSNGQQLADALATHLTYFWANGLDEFTVTPVVNDGRTIGVIIGAKGKDPSLLDGYETFKELTGFKTVEGVAAFLGVEPEDLKQSNDREAQQRKIKQARSAGGNSLEYSTSLIEREKDDNSGQVLCDMAAAELTYLSNSGLDGFLLVPVQSDGTTISVIIAPKGKKPHTVKSGSPP